MEVKKQQQPHGDSEKKKQLSRKNGVQEIPPCHYNNLTVIMTRSIENAFYRFGLAIGDHPWWTILLSVVLCGVCASGLALWKTVTDDETLWTPYGSPFIADKKWIEDNFPKDSRTETAILSGPNVLQASYMKYLSDVVQKVSQCRTSDNLYGYEDLCIRDVRENKKVNLTGSCHVESVLKIWNNNFTTIYQLTDEQVRRDVTVALEEDTSLTLAALFSNLSFDSDGTATNASALLTVWLLQENGTKVEGQARHDPVALDWELSYLEVVVGEERPEGLPEGAVLEGVAERSFDDEIDGAVYSNMVILFIGCALIFIYIALVLGRLNWVEQRMILSVMGMLVIGLAIFASFGLCFFLGSYFADMHPIIPFLLLGIGVDDMFVIVQCLENLSEFEKSLPVSEKIALTMKNAGVSITVTSVTDMMAFLIAATTSMPILRHFCIFAAMGVLFLYIFAATFFVGVAARKVCSCSKPKSESWRPNKCSQKDVGKIFFEKVVAKYILMLPVKIVLLCVTVALFGVGVYGVTMLENDYSPIWYMRESSYQQHFYINLQEYFPEHGEKVSVFVGKIKYWDNLEEMSDVYEVMQNSSYLKNGSIHFWFHEFYQEWCLDEADSSSKTNSVFEQEFNEDSSDCSTEKGFKLQLLQFINENRHYYPDFKFNISLEKANVNKLLNGEFEILVSAIVEKLLQDKQTLVATSQATRGTFQHGNLPNTTIQNIAMDEIKESMEKIVFVGGEGEEAFTTPIVYSFMYVQWEANKLMSKELVRNLILTFCTIIVVTVLLVANLRVSLMVLLCVVFTVVDVAGFAHFMGLTIEIVTSVLLILSCGLALDYAAHIGVAYICHGKGGSREERAKSSLVSMGTAVFHGGFSTFTAFALLITSDSYIFVTFFKMFAMVVLFGLFHGLIFLPVILSLIGPTDGGGGGGGGDEEGPRTMMEMNGKVTEGSSSSSPGDQAAAGHVNDSPKSMTKFDVEKRSI